VLSSLPPRETAVRRPSPPPVSPPPNSRALRANAGFAPAASPSSRLTFLPPHLTSCTVVSQVLVNDVIKAYRTPWHAVATDRGLRLPDDEEVMRSVGIRAERAIQQIFGWSDDWGETQQLAFDHYEAKSSALKTLEFTPREGVVDWLTMLNEYQVPCAVCAGTSLDRPSAESVLSNAGLSDFFEGVVSLEDGCETTEQTYLVGSIKLRRPPENCVVFEDDARGIVAAHDATAKVVAVLSCADSPADLRHADMRVSDCSDLSMMSLRELFKGAAPRR
jgi:beta-phosphoglucomutase-like phosphatase (HAD superfamily)